jgi:hypothetical protein
MTDDLDFTLALNKTDFTLALNKTRRYYKAAVRVIEHDIRAGSAAGVTQDIGDAIHEAVADNEWILSTYKAIAVLIYSDYCDAFLDLGMDSSTWGTKGIPWNQLAYCAMYQDVNSRLDDLVPHS